LGNVVSSRHYSIERKIDAFLTDLAVNGNVAFARFARHVACVLKGGA
jgi:hypothetical protein